MNPIELIKKYYDENSELYHILIQHSKDVAGKVLTIARNHPELNLDVQFLYEAAMLHDIGIFLTHAPGIQCTGENPYLAHGYLGSELLQQEGLPKHALVCERHTGTGLTAKDIQKQDLPIPQRDMVPLSLEEQVICFADCFFSKTHPGKEKTTDEVRKKLIKFGQQSVDQFNTWCDLFL